MFCSIIGGAVIGLLSVFINDTALAWTFAIGASIVWGLVCASHRDWP